MTRTDELVASLDLIPHPEGGFYRECFRSPGRLDCEWAPGESRNYMTSIYFLLTEGNFSAFHKIKSDELWHFYEGDALKIYVINASGSLEVKTLSRENYLDYVPAGCWFASRSAGNYSLVGCTVSPGFDFEDFTLADRASLKKAYPQHNLLIEELTRV